MSGRTDSAIYRLLVWALIIAIGVSAGCVSDSYKYGVDQTLSLNQPLIPESANPIARGAENPKVDRIEQFAQAPRSFVRKIARRPAINPADEELQREEAVDAAKNYLAVNGLSDVNIDVRVYAPAQQWQRLKNNKKITPLWKFTGGTLGWLRYTIFPMRAFQTDHYDPFTNTLNLNSTRPHQALYESALAKEYRKNHRLGEGTYAMMQYIPFVPLYHHAQASSDVLTYAHFHLDGEFVDELYPMTYSRLGSTAVSEALSVVSISPNAPIFTAPLLRVAGGTAGRTTGMTVVRQKKLVKNDDSSGLDLPDNSDSDASKN